MIFCCSTLSWSAFWSINEFSYKSALLSISIRLSLQRKIWTSSCWVKDWIRWFDFSSTSLAALLSNCDSKSRHFSSSERSELVKSEFFPSSISGQKMDQLVWTRYKYHVEQASVPRSSFFFRASRCNCWASLSLLWAISWIHCINNQLTGLEQVSILRSAARWVPSAKPTKRTVSKWFLSDETS